MLNVFRGLFHNEPAILLFLKILFVFEIIYVFGNRNTNNFFISEEFSKLYILVNILAISSEIVILYKFIKKLY